MVIIFADSCKCSQRELRSLKLSAASCADDYQNARLWMRLHLRFTVLSSHGAEHVFFLKRCAMILLTKKMHYLISSILEHGSVQDMPSRPLFG